MRIDLHTHSRCSDGTQAPGEVVAAAAAAGLDVLGLTDHDTTAGWAQAATAAVEHAVALVRGIEISCVSADGVSVHLLGYLTAPADPALNDELTRARESRVGRLQQMTALIGADHPVTWQDVLDQAAPGSTLGRPHLADALVSRGVVADRHEAFADLLHNRSPYYVSHHAPDPVRAVELVRNAGGVAVMAHPFAGRRGQVVSDEVIEQMAQAGLTGLEADHRDHTRSERTRARELAGRLGLVITGSSDYHGSGKANRLGENLTEPAALETILERASSPTTLVGKLG